VNKIIKKTEDDINENKKNFMKVLDVRKKIEERLDNINKLINKFYIKTSWR
jgi:hypothetical protein